MLSRAQQIWTRNKGMVTFGVIVVISVLLLGTIRHTHRAPAIPTIDVKRGEFLDSFCEVAQSLVVGDGLEPAVTMGPLHTQKAQVRAVLGTMEFGPFISMQMRTTRNLCPRDRPVSERAADNRDASAVC